MNEKSIVIAINMLNEQIVRLIEATERVETILKDVTRTRGDGKNVLVVKIDQ